MLENFERMNDCEVDDCVSSLSDSHMSDFSLGSIELLGGTPVTNESFEILELQSKWIGVELGVIEQMKVMFAQKTAEIINYHTNLLNLDVPLSSMFLNAVYQFDETEAMSYLRLLWSRQELQPHTVIVDEFFNAMTSLLQALSQIKYDEYNLRSLLETNRQMKFSPCSFDEMHAYYKKIHKQRRENYQKDLLVKKGNKNQGVPKTIQFQTDTTTSILLPAFQN